MKKYMNVYVLTRVIGVVVIALLLLEGSRLYVDFKAGKYLREAIITGDSDAVEWNLKMGVNPNIYVYNEYSKTREPVMYYMVTGSRNLNGIELMVRYGADFKLYGAWGGEMIMHATRHNKIEIIEYILNQGVYLQDKDGFIATLVDRFAGMDPEEEKIIPLIMRAMKLGLDINYRDKKFGTTPLEIAESRDCHVLAAKLRELGAK